jgi:hypothetical protein
LIQAGVPIDTDRGVSDEGDPWFVFCRKDTGDVFVHFARIADSYVAATSAAEGAIWRQKFDDLIEKLGSENPLLLPSQNQRTTLLMHPSTVFLAVVFVLFHKHTSARTEGFSNEADLAVGSETKTTTPMAMSDGHVALLFSALSILAALHQWGYRSESSTEDPETAAAEVHLSYADDLGDGMPVLSHQRASLVENDSLGDISFHDGTSDGNVHWVAQQGTHLSPPTVVKGTPPDVEVVLEAIEKAAPVSDSQTASHSVVAEVPTASDAARSLKEVDVSSTDDGATAPPPRVAVSKSFESDQLPPENSASMLAEDNAGATFSAVAEESEAAPPPAPPEEVAGYDYVIFNGIVVFVGGVVVEPGEEVAADVDQGDVALVGIELFSAEAAV